MARDYNPDREGHVKKKWTVVKAIKDSNFTGVNIDGKMMKFGRDGAFRVSDPMVAEAIRQQVGSDAVVTRVRYPDHADRGHTYFFGAMPAMPWHVYDEYGRRVDNAAQEGKISEDSVDEHPEAEAGGIPAEAVSGDRPEQSGEVAQEAEES